MRWSCSARRFLQKGIGCGPSFGRRWHNDTEYRLYRAIDRVLTSRWITNRHVRQQGDATAAAGNEISCVNIINALRMNRCDVIFSEKDFRHHTAPDLASPEYIGATDYGNGWCRFQPDARVNYRRYLGPPESVIPVEWQIRADPPVLAYTRYFRVYRFSIDG